MLQSSPLVRPSPQAQLATPLADAGQQRPEPRQPGLGGLGPEDLAMGAVLRFKTLMKLEGQSVHVARMCYDRLYAYERIAQAHASASDPLRRLALELFQAYHRRDDARNMSV